MEAIANDRTLLAGVDEETARRLMIAAGRIADPDKKAQRRLTRKLKRQAAKEKKERNQQLLARTGIRKLRENPIFKTPRRLAARAGEQPVQSEPIGEVENERVCYGCQARYTKVHFFYDQMCGPCGDLGFAKRTQTADLNGRVALVTGSRVKIGFRAALMLLRAGCRVLCTTRFPKDAARRYAAEEDFSDWSDRIEIHGIDLRHTPSVEALCATLNQTHSRLDFIINNACQTVRRPSGFYDHLMDGEHEALPNTESGLLRLAGDAGTPLSAPDMTQLPLLPEDRERGNHLFPKGQLDADLQQVDLRKVNSWRLRHHEVSTLEVLEVQLVNAVAPYVLNARLKPLMLAVPTADKHIVNVSAVEGQFYRTFKSERHPHTNMAKAALNMMTRTSALDYIADGIHMNAVDTGWVTDEDPADHAARKQEEHSFHPPLDIVDGAARICDPIFMGIATGTHVWGQFLKNYKEADW
jgi:NAD(P)-dependent dehydrogenase (short-subunit alcohol dehydrogenase family)